MLASPQHAGLVCGSQRSMLSGLQANSIDCLDRGPQSRQPLAVPEDLPVSIHLHHAAELPIGAGSEVPACGADGQLQAEGHAAVRAQIIGIVGIAHGTLKFGEEKRQRLGIVPDMCATALAAAGSRGGSPPSRRTYRLPDAAPWGISEWRYWPKSPPTPPAASRRQKQRIFETRRLRLAGGPNPPGRIVRCAGDVSTGWRSSSSTTLDVRLPVVLTVGEIPGDHIAHAACFSRRHDNVRCQQTFVARRLVFGLA